MPNPHGTSAQRQARAQLLDRLEAGDLDPTCPRCLLPIHPDQADQLDADHYDTDVRAGQPPDRLAHAHCNRSAGAAMGNRARGQGRGQAWTPRTSRAW